MARWSSSRSSAATICAPAAQGAGFKRCCLKRGAYDGALRAYYFQRVRTGEVKTPLAGSRIARPYGVPGLPFASLRAFGTRKGPLGLFACVPQDVPHSGKDECGGNAVPGPSHGSGRSRLEKVQRTFSFADANRLSPPHPSATLRSRSRTKRSTGPFLVSSHPSPRWGEGIRCRSDVLRGGEGRGPGPLEVEAAEMAGDVEGFADEEEAGDGFCFHCL